MATRRWVERENSVEVAWGARLWDWRLNTDSFCLAAGPTARGDRTVVVRPGQNRCVRMRGEDHSGVAVESL